MLSYDHEDDQYSPFRCDVDGRDRPAPSQSLECIYISGGQGLFDPLDSDFP